MKILVPLDGSVLAECMLGPAQTLAGPDGELFLVQVLVGDDNPTKDARDAGEAYLESQRKRLEAQGLRVRWDLEGGDPAERILVIAGERAPDFVAMATHGQSGRSRGVRGSVAERVLRESRVPLLLANPRGIPTTHEEFFKSLLVPLDGSELADEVLPHVERLALAFESEVVLFRVQPAGRFSQDPFDPSEVAATLAPQRERLAARGIRVRRWAAKGDPAEQILRAAEDVGLVCMSTHGRSGLSRWWFGSVAEQVVRLCSRPLLVVRPRPE